MTGASSSPAALFQGRRTARPRWSSAVVASIRPEFGRASTFVETVDVPWLEQLSARFLGEIEYYGLAELEYKLDPRSGQFKLLDFNARTWGYHTLGFGAGVDFPYLQFADQIGETVTPCRARVGIRWVRLVTDLPTAALEIYTGRFESTGVSSIAPKCSRRGGDQSRGSAAGPRRAGAAPLPGRQARVLRHAGDRGGSHDPRPPTFNQELKAEARQGVAER